MSYRPLILLSCAVLALMVGASVAAGMTLPEEARLPVHWSIDGTPDRFAEKWTALLTLPATTLFVALLYAGLPALEPMRDGLERSANLYTWLWVSTLALMAGIHATTLATALGWALPVARIVLVLLGAFFIGVGNQLAKSRRMFFIGIRTPWTLADEDVWIATHRLAGRLMMASGAGFWLVAAGGADGALSATMLAIALVTTAAVPAAYSYILWRCKTGAG